MGLPEKCKISRMESSEAKRLEVLMDDSAKTCQNAAQQRADKSSELAKQHTEYLEKLAFGSGAVLTAIVSFVGGKRELHPSWLLRSTIMALGFTIISILVRNAIYPYYVGTIYGRRALKAEIDRDAAKAEFFSRVPAMDIDTGKPIDALEYINSYQENRKLCNIKLPELEKLENRYIKWCRDLEMACLVSTSTAVGFLIFIVWKNF